VQFYPNCER
jgi:hypothetical protein